MSNLRSKMSRVKVLTSSFQIKSAMIPSLNQNLKPLFRMIRRKKKDKNLKIRSLILKS